MSGNKVEGDLLWDGKFKDGTKAAPGEYFITLKISDAAGNERMMSTVVSVTLLNALIPLPALELPVITLTPTPLPQGEGGGAATFGGETVVPSAQPTPSTFSGGGTRVEEQPVTTQTVSKAPVTSSFPVPSSAILWGAASAAAVGYFVSEAQRRKQEEERREREAAEAQQNALAQMFAYREPESEPKVPRHKNKPLTPQERLQAIWDANGAAIYKVNQAFKTAFGRDMDAATRKKAIKDATKNGHFNAGAYAGNLVKAATPPPPPNPYAGAADRIRAGANEIDDEKKIGYVDPEVLKAREEKARQEQAERDAAYRAWRVEETTYTPPAPQPAPDLQAGLQALYEGRKAGEAEAAQQAADLLNDPNLPPADNLAVPLGGSTVNARAPANTQHSKSWWQKTLDWVDNHQPETSIGVGALVGAIAIGVTLVVVGTITLPVLAVAAGVAAVAAGVTVAAGTMGLNAHYDRPTTANIWNNVKAAAITAAAVTGIGLFVAGGLMTQAVVVTGNAIAGTCAANPAVCANAGVVLDVADKAEEAALVVQLTVETVTGNPHAGETAIELQLEQMDGGAPGNTVAAELGEQLAKLGDDVPELIATYGDDIIPLLLKYQDDAVDIIGAYGKDGVVLLRKFGSDTPQAINLIKDFGTPAVRLLDTLDVKSAGKLLRNLDADVLDYAVQQGPDAVRALSKWKPEELKEFGVELALRAEKDAKALKALDELTKLDINSSDPAIRAEVNRLIQEIAENSRQGSGERFVLGLWDNKNGIAGGYVSDARLNGGEYYASHPDIYNKLEAVYGKGDPRINETLWQINQAALQKQIAKGMDFDYSLASTKSIKEYKAEVEYVKQIVAGNVAEVLKALRRDSLPARLKEVQLLVESGYTPHYDDAARVIHWTLEP